MNDVYYSPEKFGLTTVGEVELSNGSYEFDLFVVWQDSAGTYLWGRDAGCSCPSPFEYQGIDGLDRGTAHEAAAALQKVLDERDDYDRRNGYGEAAAVELIGRMMKNRG